MKKLFTLLLCLVLVLSLVACGGKDAETTSETVAPEAPSDTAEGSESVSEEAHDHTHINFNGQVTVFAPEALAGIVGRECDFTYDQNGSTMYIYNNVTVEGLLFTQVQFSFNEDHNRISCTYSANTGDAENPRDPAEISAEIQELLENYEKNIEAIYGEGAHSEQHGSSLVSWRDHTGNYIILTQINDTTIQLAYYIYAQQG